MKTTLVPQSVFTTTTLTVDIKTEEQLKTVIQNNTHYQLIPASPQTTSSIMPLIPTLIR